MISLSRDFARCRLDVGERRRRRVWRMAGKQLAIPLGVRSKGLK